MADVHAGSWFGLPDFGVTEAIGGLFGAPKTASGGSNISAAFAPQQNAQVLGSGTQKSTWQNPSDPKFAAGNAFQTSPVATSNNGGGSAGGGDAHINPSTGVWDDNYFASQQQNNVNSREQQVRGEIDNGYNGYFGQLDSILNEGLPGQKAAQEGIVNSQYDQGVNQLNTQKALGQQDLQGQRDKAGTQQAKTLQDLSDNIRNLFQSGNVYLGARGASDSSASNQYAYGLTKMGSQQRGDVTAQYAGINNDINARETRLNEIHSGQINDLKSQHDQQVNQIAQWFGEQQNALKQAKAQGQLQKGQDLASLSQNLLNVALQQLQTVQQEAQAKRQSLDQWAMNHSNDIGQLKNNLSQVSSTNYSMPTATAVNGQPAVAGGAGNPSLFGYGQEQDKNKTNLFGQPLG